MSMVYSIGIFFKNVLSKKKGKMPVLLLYTDCLKTKVLTVDVFLACFGYISIKIRL